MLSQILIFTLFSAASLAAKSKWEIVERKLQPTVFVNVITNEKGNEQAVLRAKKFVLDFCKKNKLGPADTYFTDFKKGTPEVWHLTVGFVVKKPLEKAFGELFPGSIPAGRYLSYKHLGPYSELRDLAARAQTFARNNKVVLDLRPLNFHPVAAPKTPVTHIHYPIK